MKRDEVIKKALMLETQDRTAFLDGIDDPKLKAEVAFIVNDDEELTSFVLQTAAADIAMEQVKFDDLKPGQKINRITIKSLVGKGGMGQVYLAYDETLQRNVAIKSIRPEYLSNPSTQQRFIQEAQILSQINHPAICQIYDYIESDTGNLLVLEWIDGVTLNQTSLNHKQVMPVLAELASALEAAHEKGIIHRDLKPENIMISHSGQVKVLDFGIAQSVTDQSKDHSPIGTLRYMSPEQARGETVTLFSDIYAFGLIMSELLSDQPCYHFDDTASLLDAVTKAQVQVPTGIKKAHRKLIAQCVTKHPEARPTADQLVQHFEQFQGRSHNRWLVALLVLSLAGGGLIGKHLWQKNQASLAFADFSQRIDALHDKRIQTETLPAHDTSEKNSGFQERSQTILADILSNPVLNDVDKDHLKGKLYYHNRDYTEAVAALAAAHQQDPDNPELASLYVQALSQNYFIILSQNIEDTEVGQANNTALTAATNELKTTLQALGQKHTFKNHPVYPLLTATDHILNQAYDQAIKAIVTPETYEEGQYGPLYLAGIIKRQQGLRSFYQSDFSGALKQYQQALNLFRSSNDFARSYMGNYYEFCYLSSEMLKTHQYHSSDVAQPYHQAVNRCEEGLVIDPNDQYIMSQLATINWRYGQWLLNHGQSPDVYFDQSLAWGKRSLAISETPEAWENQGIVHDLIALQKIEKGQDPYPDLTLALTAYDHVNQLNPAQITQTTGNQLYALNIKSQYQLRTGDDVAVTAQHAWDLVNNAQKHPEYQLAQASSIYNNFAYIALLAAISDHHLGRDPDHWLAHSKRFYSGIETELGNNSQFAAAGLAEAHWFAAEVASSQSSPFASDLSTAIKYTDQSLSFSRQYYWMPLTKAKTLLLGVKTNGSEDPTADLAEAKTLLDESLALNPNYVDTHLVLAYWHLIKMALAEPKTDQLKHYQQGMARCDQATSVNPRAAEPWLLKLAFERFAQAKGLTTAVTKEDQLSWQSKAQQLNPHATLWHFPFLD